MVDDLTTNYKCLEDLVAIDMENDDEENITDAEGERNEIIPQLETTRKSHYNTEADESVAVYEAQCNVIFDLSVIAEIVTYKSSVVGVSLCFELFLSQIFFHYKLFINDLTWA